MICLLVMTDGRDTIHEAIRSAEMSLSGPITRLVIHDDTGDKGHVAALAERYPAATVIGGPRVGFGGAISRAWAHVRDLPVKFVFHLEDDFTFNREVNLSQMCDVLEDHSHLQQLALRRQPWNPAEHAAGGIVEQHPDEYRDVTDDTVSWLEHRRFFTTNPSLYRRTLCELPWPTGPQSEGRFGIDLFARHDDNVAGYWGARDSGEWVTHIGAERMGKGY